LDGSDEANCTVAAVPAVPFKGLSLIAHMREVKMRKPTKLAALSKNKTKRTEKKIREERMESRCSRRSQRKSRQ
jgi:hypothetical protein